MKRKLAFASCRLAATPLLGLLVPLGCLAQVAANTVPTPAQFQRLVPQNAMIESTQSVYGTAAVMRLRNKLGVNVDAAQKLGFETINSNSSYVIATLRHSAKGSVQAVLSGAADTSVTSQSTAGDSYTERWASGGWSYTATYAWKGTIWELTNYTATKSTDRPR